MFLDFGFFLPFLQIIGCLIFYGFFFLFFFFFLSKVLRLLLKVTKVTSGHQTWHKMGQISIISQLFAQKNPRPKPSAGARGRPA